MHIDDIVVDTLTFPITTGQEEVRRDALETIEAIRQLKRRHPEVRRRCWASRTCCSG